MSDTRSPHPPLASLAREPLLTRDYDTDPVGVYESLRRRYGPVAPVDLLGVPVWAVLGYGEALEVLRDVRGIWRRDTAHWKAWRDLRVPPDWPLRPIYDLKPAAFRDGEYHREVQAAWSAALTPFQDLSYPQARNLENHIGRRADELIDVLADGGGRIGSADLAAQYARPLPLMILDHLLAFDEAQSEDVIMDMWRLTDAGPDAAMASKRLLTAFGELAAAKMARPGDDLLSYMLAARPTFTAEELALELGICVGLMDLTSALICNAVVEILTGNSGARAGLSAGITRETVNHVAMANPPLVNLSFRFPVVDVRLGNYRIAAGDPVMVSIPAAHTDPQLVGTMNPQAVLSTRAHLGWGAGPHACVAQQLASRITAVAVDRLFTRLPGLTLTLPPDHLPWRPSPLFRALRSLPVRFEIPQRAPGQASFASAPAATTADAAHRRGGPDTRARSGLWGFLQRLRGER
jgi:cytochrome P450